MSRCSRSSCSNGDRSPLLENAKPEVDLYVRSGLSVIPLGASSKRPIIDWKVYQSHHPSEQELEQWFSNGENNIGILCGGISGNLCVLDVDKPELLSLRPLAELAAKTITVKTSRGLHLWVRSLVPARIIHRPSYGLDLISDGGYVLAPPSIHPTGWRYEFASDIREILEIPDVNKIVEWLDQQHNYHNNGELLEKPLGNAGIVEGERNNTLFRSATVDREQGVPEDVAVVRAQDLNLKSCNPPLPPAEVYTLVRSAYSKAYFQNAAQKIVNGESKPDMPPKTLKALEGYVNDLRLRIVGEQPPAEAYESLDALYEEVVRYYETSLKLDHLTPYLFASYTLLTHQAPNLDFIFQLYITGLKGSGKSTAGERLEALCYQGFKTGSATFPFLVRANEVLNGMTQVLDEFDLIAGDDRVTKYLRGSTDRRNPYGVVEPVSIGGQTYNMPAIKNSFGARILITSFQLKDEMTRDRALETIMMQYAGLLPEPSAKEVTKLRAYLAYYREHVTLKVTVEDKRKWYDPKHSSGRLNEIATLLYLVTPVKYHVKIAAIIQREWETRTALERESYAAKVVEALTAAVLADDTKEAPTGETFVPVQEIKRHFDVRYADPQTGKGKTKPASIGRVIHNLGLRTTQLRVKDEEQRLRGWRLDKAALVRIRQSLYLDETPELVSTVSNVTGLRAPSTLDTHIQGTEREAVHTLASETTETTETKQETSTT